MKTTKAPKINFRLLVPTRNKNQKNMKISFPHIQETNKNSKIVEFSMQN
jgi:hypothetical protein